MSTARAIHVLSIVEESKELDLSVEELRKLELVLELSKGAFTAEGRRQQLAFALFIAHRNGIKNRSGSVLFAEDEQLKAEYFLAVALLFIPAVPPPIYFLNFFARGTSARLAVVRVFRLHPLSCLALTTSTGALFSALQLSYFVELAFCFSILMEKSLRPQTSKDEWWFQRIEGHRFKQAFLDREFLGIFTNAVIWGVVNGVCYFDPGITPAAKALWNLGGFFLDIAHDWGVTHLELNEYKELRDSIGNKKFQVDDIDLQDVSFQTNLANKIKVLKFKEARLTIAAVLIFVGMILVFAPALAPALVSFFHFHPFIVFWLTKITPQFADTLRNKGADLVIFAGVCIAGLGGRLFFSGVTWERVRKLFFNGEIRTAFFNWFSKDTFYDNFVPNMLVPMGSMGVLMLAALFCSPATVIMTACILMTAWFVLMKMNYSFFPPAVIPVSPTLLDGLIDVDSKLDIHKLSEMSKEQLSNFKALHTIAGVGQNRFVKAVKDWSKEEKERPSDSTMMIRKIMGAHGHVSAVSTTVNSATSVSEVSPHSSDEDSPKARDDKNEDSSLRRRLLGVVPPPLAVNSPPDIQAKGNWFNWFNLFRYCFGNSVGLSRSTSTYNARSMCRVDTRG